MTPYYIRTANKGWLDHPNTFAHIGKRLGVTVLVQSDLALADHEYRVYADTTPVTKTLAIDEECGRKIRKAISDHQAAGSAKVDKPTEIPPPPANEERTVQAKLW